MKRDVMISKNWDNLKISRAGKNRPYRLENETETAYKAVVFGNDVVRLRAGQRTNCADAIHPQKRRISASGVSDSVLSCVQCEIQFWHLTEPDFILQ